MNTLSTDMYNLLDFLCRFILVYIPCVIGAVCGIYFKSEYLPKKDRARKKKSILHALGFSFSSSIVPALIILISEYLLPDKTTVNHILKYGISMLFGFIGSDRITEYLMNIANLFKVFKAVSEGINGLSKLSEESLNNDEK